MYCIKCGIELSDGQKICPICQTRVYHPDFKNSGRPSYPEKEYQSEAINKRGILFVISVLCLLPLLLPMIFELTLASRVSWSGYVTGGTLLGYFVFVFPFWFKRSHPIIFVPCFFGAAASFVWFVSFDTDGNWFFTFALPIIFTLGMIVSAITTLTVKLRRARLYVIGGGIIALGVWTMLIEFLLHATFGVTHTVYWSLFSLLTMFILGMMLIVIAIVKPWKESLRKFFFLD